MEKNEYSVEFNVEGQIYHVFKDGVCRPVNKSQKEKMEIEIITYGEFYLKQAIQGWILLERPAPTYNPIRNLLSWLFGGRR